MTHIAIDTCVFEHYLNLIPKWNQDHHIDHLLAALQRRGIVLCVDNKNRIAGEYEIKIKPIIASRDEGGIERYVLSYWMLHCPRAIVDVEDAGFLMNRIKRNIIEQEPVDQTFVYVACAGDCKLITNDDEHILGRRKALRKDTKEYSGENTDFISSKQAKDILAQPVAAE